MIRILSISVLATVACSQTPAPATDAGSVSPIVDGGTPDADAFVCSPSTAAVEVGSYWSAFVSRGTPNKPDELWAVRIDDGQPAPAIKLNGPIVDGGRVQASPLDSVLPFVWSFDGNSLAYVARQEDRMKRELYVVDMSASTPGPARKVNGFLVDDGDVFDYAFSPDSSMLAYISDQAVDNVRELFVVDLSQPTLSAQRVNGVFTSLLSNVQGFQWSSDSTHLSYVANEDNPDKADLYLSDVSGSAPSQSARVTTLIPGQNLGRDYHWSPVASTLAYLVNSPGSGELLLASVSAGQVSATESPVPPGGFLRFDWTSDGSKILMVKNSKINYLDPLTGSTELVSSIAVNEMMPFTLSPDSERIAVISATGHVYTGPTDGSAPSLLSLTYITANLSWTPDSSELVLRAQVGGSPSSPELYLSDLDGDPRRVSGDFVAIEEGLGLVQEQFATSPDGSRLLYLADHNYLGVYELYMVDLQCDTAPNQKVNADITPGLAQPDGEVYDFQWSPDGTMIMYHGTQDVSDRPDLYLVNASQGTPSAPVVINLDLADTRGVSYYQWSPRALP